MSKSAGKGLKSMKKLVDKVNHTSKLRTNIQAGLAVGKKTLNSIWLEMKISPINKLINICF